MSDVVLHCKKIVIVIQSNVVITNRSGPAIFVRYNRVLLYPGYLYTKMINLTQNVFVIMECSLTTEFVITEFQILQLNCY